jgi:aminoglycoside 2''-phosphotransferase
LTSDHLTVEAANLLLRAHCPDLNVYSIFFLGKGEFCTAYLVNGTSVFRFANYSYVNECLLREACLLPTIAQQFNVRIPVPKLINTESEPAFISYPFVRGSFLTRKRYLHMLEDRREICAGTIANFINALHDTDLELARNCGVAQIDEEAYISRLWIRVQDSLLRVLGKEERTWIEESIQKYCDMRRSPTFLSVLLHHDISPQHVLYDQSKDMVMGVIDFGDMEVGDPCREFLLLYVDFGLDFLSRVVKSYRNNDRPGLITRMFQYYLLDQIDLAARRAKLYPQSLHEIVSRICFLRQNEGWRFEELISGCEVE